MPLRRTLPVLVALLVIAGVAGCQPKDPRLEPITAGSPSAFARWRMMAGDRIGRDEWREFDAMLQEIGLRVTAEKRASGSEAVEAAVRADIDGKVFREVLLMGYEARLKRAVPERREVHMALEENIRRATAERSGTTTAGDIRRMRERQDKRLAELDAEIAHAQQRAAELRRLPGLPEAADAATPPEKR